MYGSRLKEIETRILRRIPLGSTAPKQRVVDVRSRCSAAVLLSDCLFRSGVLFNVAYSLFVTCCRR